MDLSGFVNAAVGVGRALTDPSSGVVEVDLNPILISSGHFEAVAVDAVVPEDLEPLELDRDHPTAFATVSASTCSRTSWTRKIVAPRS